MRGPIPYRSTLTYEPAGGQNRWRDHSRRAHLLQVDLCMHCPPARRATA